MSDVADQLRSDAPLGEDVVGSHLAGIRPHDFKNGLKDPRWRIRNLYWIIDKENRKVLFVPNEAQERLYGSMWWRNIILKARQRGFSTAIQLLMLDTCLFTWNTSAAVIADTEPNATIIFRKIKFAYDNLPVYLLNSLPLMRDSASELILANNSSLRVATSARSATLQFLHVSEFGKICAHYPERAREIVAGSLPAAESGVAFIESTAEGREGPFYEMTQKAEALAQTGKKLSRHEYKFHFEPWWAADEYRTDPRQVVIAGKEHDYFNRVETLTGNPIEAEQRAWYIAMRDNTFGGDWALMKQEYPSTSDEAFEQSQEGVYYAEQLAAARRTDRVTDIAYDPRVPVNTFWDLGKDDDTCIWFHQHINGWDNWIDYFAASDQAFSFYAKILQEKGYVWGKHYLPHDGEHRSWGLEQLKSAADMLYELGLRNIIVVPRTPNLTIAIRQTRDAGGQAALPCFATCAAGEKFGGAAKGIHMRKPSPLGTAIEAAINRDGRYRQFREPAQYSCFYQTPGGQVFAIERVTLNQIRLWLRQNGDVRSAAEKQGLV